jgi:DNA-binding GntR family transcriptional regulator
MMYVAEVIAQVERIIARGLEDDKLSRETLLAEEIGCSLGTLRRALRELAGRGVIVRRHGYGTFLAGVELPVDPRDIRPTRIQLADRIEKMIADGEITGGFPPYRQFALQLGVGWETLLSSYALLRERDVIYTVTWGRMKGTYVNKEKPTT